MRDMAPMPFPVTNILSVTSSPSSISKLMRSLNVIAKKTRVSKAAEMTVPRIPLLSNRRSTQKSVGPSGTAVRANGATSEAPCMASHKTQKNKITILLS